MWFIQLPSGPDPFGGMLCGCGGPFICGGWLWGGGYGEWGDGLGACGGGICGGWLWIGLGACGGGIGLLCGDGLAIVTQFHFLWCTIWPTKKLFTFYTFFHTNFAVAGANTIDFHTLFVHFAFHSLIGKFNRLFSIKSSLFEKTPSSI